MNGITSQLRFHKRNTVNAPTLPPNDGERLSRIETKVEHIDQETLRVEGKIEKMDDRLDELNNRMRTQLMWIIGVVLTSGLITHFMS